MVASLNSSLERNKEEEASQPSPLRPPCRCRANMAHTARFCPWFSGQFLQNLSSCSLFARNQQTCELEGLSSAEENTTAKSWLFNNKYGRLPLGPYSRTKCQQYQQGQLTAGLRSTRVGQVTGIGRPASWKGRGQRRDGRPRVTCPTPALLNTFCVVHSSLGSGLALSHSG